MGDTPTRLILASGSPARRELMARLGRPFEVIPAAVEEPLEAGTGDARSYVAHIAWIKAAAVAKQVDRGIIIAADTVGWLDGKPVLKPEDEADARRILTSLGGRDHELWTGVVLWRRPDDVQLVWQEVSRVTMSACRPKSWTSTSRRANGLAAAVRMRSARKATHSCLSSGV